MSDIIQDAKKLLEGVTPAPWVASDNGYIGSTSGIMIHDGQVLGDTTEDTNLIAAAPELAQALSEETWEYQVQARSTKRPAWKASTNGVLQKWYGYEDVEEAKGNARMYTPSFSGDRGVEIRVLRRRVSNAEVME